MEIYFVRHTSVAVAPGTCYGHTDVPLSSSFNEEASETKSHLDGIDFDAVYSSPLSRAMKLAAFCGYSNPITDSRLIELNFGDWEMCRYDDLYKESPEFRDWCSHHISYRCPHGESLEDQTARVRSFVESLLQQPYRRVCVFCHGGVLAIARSLDGSISLEKSLESIPPYGSVIKIEL